MTKETPTLEDITKSFYEKCECTKHSYDLTCNTACDYCNVGVSGINSGCSGEGTSMGECVQKYIYEVATGARDINAPLWNPHKAEPPSWCKDGQWVMGYDKTLGVIIEVDDCEGNIMPFARIRTVGASHITSITLSGVAQYYTPIRFRPYSYEEALNLLGKRLENPDIDGFYGVDLVCSVGYDRESGDVLVNGFNFNSLTEDRCIIDGHPFGVPEIDEEAMKGDKNDE